MFNEALRVLPSPPYSPGTLRDQASAWTATAFKAPSARMAADQHLPHPNQDRQTAYGSRGLSMFNGRGKLPPMLTQEPLSSSPDAGYTPESADADSQVLDDNASVGSSSGENATDDASLQNLTPAERLAMKRRMKRFRLTHSQTRYLMNEFTKQAHPDAVHRERLSREIPGLSPRQVQVWFQNRRAKLKRLTSEDRDRMMRSRALPSTYEMVQAANMPFSTQMPLAPALYASVQHQSAYPQESHVPSGLMDPRMRQMSERGAHVYQHEPVPAPTAVYNGFGHTPPHSATAATFATSFAEPSPQLSRRYTADMSVPMGQQAYQYAHAGQTMQYADVQPSPLRSAPFQGTVSRTSYASGEAPAYESFAYQTYDAQRSAATHGQAGTESQFYANGHAFTPPSEQYNDSSYHHTTTNSSIPRHGMQLSNNGYDARSFGVERVNTAMHHGGSQSGYMSYPVQQTSQHAYR